jgi:hypothetical protein
MRKVRLKTDNTYPLAVLSLIEEDGTEHPIPFVKSVSMYLDASTVAPILTVELYKTDIELDSPFDQIAFQTVLADVEVVQPVGAPYPESETSNE